MTYLVSNKKYKVKWADIQSFSDWKEKKEILQEPPAIIESVYIYIGKGRGGLCFAGEYHDGEYGNSTIIPKGCIIKINKIR